MTRVMDEEWMTLKKAACRSDISPNHKKLTRVTNDLVKPNGLIGRPDGKTLYIADAGGR